MFSSAQTKRKFWYIRVLNSGGRSSVVLWKKDARGKHEPFSDSPKSAQVKNPWGPLFSCKVKDIKHKGEEVKVMAFENSKRQSASCDVDLFCPISFETNPFTQKISCLRVSKLQVLADYLNLLPKAQGFDQHDELIYEENGIRKDQTGTTETVIKDHGGELKELENFISLARAYSVKTVNSVTKDDGNVKRKSSENSGHSAPEKVTKLGRQEKNKEKELKDAEGLEQRFSSGYVGFKDIPLSSLRVYPPLKKKLITFKVTGIANSIRERPDPAKICMTVAPDPDQSTEEETTKFVVIGGTHTLAALKELDRRGDLDKINVLKDKLIPSVIVNISDQDLMLYGNIRSNDIASEYVRKPRAQDLVKLFENYLDNPSKGLKVITRMLRIQSVSAEEAAAVLRLVNWKKDNFLKLTDVFTKYEHFETRDIEEKKKNSTNMNHKMLAKGQTAKISASMLVNVSRLEESWFANEIHRVLYQEISLQGLIQEGSDRRLRADLITKVLNISEYGSFSDLQEKNPDKFRLENLDSFLGAKVEPDDAKGKLLRQYVKDSLAETSTSDVNKQASVKFECIDRLNVTNEDFLVLLVRDHLDDNLVEEILLRENPSMLIFQSEKYQALTLSKIRGENKWCVPIIFERGNEVKDDESPHIVENIIFCILVGIGKQVILEPPLKMFNGPLTQNLGSVVDRLTSNGNQIRISSELELISVHQDLNSSKEVSW